MLHFVIRYKWLLLLNGIFSITTKVSPQSVEWMNLDAAKAKLWFASGGKTFSAVRFSNHPDDPDCAIVGLSRAKAIMLEHDIKKGLETAMKKTFELAGQLATGSLGKIAYESFSQTLNAATADSPEEFVTAATNSALGKLSSYGLDKKIENEEARKLFNSAFTQIIKALVKDPEASLINILSKQGVRRPCENYHYTLQLQFPTQMQQPNLFQLQLRVSEDACKCHLIFANQPHSRLNYYWVQSTLPMTLDSVALVKTGIFGLGKEKKRIYFNVQDAIPVYEAFANCCTHPNGDISTAEEPISHEKYSPLLFAGYGGISEQATERFMMHGINAFFALPLRGPLGAMVDLGYHGKKDDMISFQRLQWILGIYYYFWLKEQALALQPYLLGGYNRLGVNVAGNRSGTGNLSTALGSAFHLQLQGHFMATLRADFNPVFAKGETLRNFRLGAGLTYRFAH